MNKGIKVIIDGIEYKGHLDDSRSPNTTMELLNKLPVEGTPVKWGGEIYFDVDISQDHENATEDIDVGDIAYWPPGGVLCIFFGKTPISTSDKPKPASDVNVVGHLDNAEVLSKFQSISHVRIEIEDARS